MSRLNILFNALTDRLLEPFAGESPWPALALASFVAAVILVGLLRLTSPQAALGRARNRFISRVLELLLFRHDLRVSLTACGRILKANAVYLAQFALPLLAGAVPMLLIFVQLEAWFESRPFRSGEAAVLEAQLFPAHDVMQTDVAATAGPFATVETAGVRVPSRNAVSWRLRVIEEGNHAVEVRVGDAIERKQLAAGPALARVSTERVSPGFWKELLHPSEAPLPAGGVFQSIELRHPPRILWLGLTEVPWMLAAVVLMMAFGLALGKLFGVRLA